MYVYVSELVRSRRPTSHSSMATTSPEMAASATRTTDAMNAMDPTESTAESSIFRMYIHPLVISK